MIPRPSCKTCFPSLQVFSAGASIPAALTGDAPSHLLSAQQVAPLLGSGNAVAEIASPDGSIDLEVTYGYTRNPDGSCPTNRTELFVTLAVCLVAFALAGCSPKAGMWPISLAVQREDVIARKFMEQLFNGYPESAEQSLLPELQNDKSLETLRRASEGARGLQIKQTELVDASYMIRSGPGNGVTKEVHLMYQLQHPTGWSIITITVLQKNGQEGVSSIDAKANPTSLADLNRFSFSGRTGVHYLYLLLAVAVPVFCVFSIAICARSKVRKKWFWLFFMLFGFCSFKLNWTTGHTSVEPISIELLGASILRSGLYGPWVISWSLPIGAALFLLMRKKLLRGEPSEPAN
ncbi:MAG: hypothetical protein JO271_03725 [Verrucomicrobia bacterium]|nr:hypothetical protein [Verrucomicrobiota bacterium]